MLTLWINQAYETKNTILCEVSLSTKDIREDTSNATEDYRKILAPQTEWVLTIQQPSTSPIFTEQFQHQICIDCQAPFVHGHCKPKTTVKKQRRKQTKKLNSFSKTPLQATTEADWCHCSFALSCPNEHVRENNGKKTEESQYFFFWHTELLGTYKPPGVSCLSQVPRPWLGTIPQSFKWIMG